MNVEDQKLILLLASSSASLERVPGKNNWIERANGELPPYVRKLARGIMKSGKSLSQAISIAISRCKVWAAGGDDVTAATRAKAAKAVAQWEALKAKNGAGKVVKASRADGSSYLMITDISPVVTTLVCSAFSADQRKKLASSGAAMSGGSYPIRNEEDLKNAIQAVGRAKNYAAARKHIISRAKALGLTSLLPEDWTSSKDVVKASSEEDNQQLSLANDGSYNTDIVSREWRVRESAKARKTNGDYPYGYVRELWSDFIIVEYDGYSEKIPYTVSGTEVEFGEPLPVKQVWVEDEDSKLSDEEAELLKDVLTRGTDFLSKIQKIASRE